MAESNPPKCLSFTIEGQWGHFKKVSGNVVKESYMIMPRTTIAGMIAAMLGLERDSYYHFFQEENSAIAIEPQRPLRTQNFPINSLATDKSDLNTVSPNGVSLKIKYPDATSPRKQHIYEMLVKPSYRIDIWVKDEEIYNRLKTRLEQGTSHYTPTLGLSELIARIEYHGEYTPKKADENGVVEVDSAIPNDDISDIIPEAGSTHRTEKSPSIMEADDGSRITTEFTPYGFNPTSESLKVKTDNAMEINNRTVIFS